MGNQIQAKHVPIVAAGLQLCWCFKYRLFFLLLGSIRNIVVIYIYNSYYNYRLITYNTRGEIMSLLRDKGRWN